MARFDTSTLTVKSCIKVKQEILLLVNVQRTCIHLSNLQTAGLASIGKSKAGWLLKAPIRSASLHANGQLAKVKPFLYIAPSFQEALLVMQIKCVVRLECVTHQLRYIAPPFGAFQEALFVM